MVYDIDGQFVDAEFYRRCAEYVMVRGTAPEWRRDPSYWWHKRYRGGDGPG